MKTIEELKKEKEELIKQAQKYYAKSYDIANEILARTSDETKKYFNKYLKLDKGGYMRYAYIKYAEKDGCCADTWRIEGPGFTTYINENGERYFTASNNGFSMDDLNGDKIEIISKEQFYDDRKKYITEIINERYE